MAKNSGLGKGLGSILPSQSIERVAQHSGGSLATGAVDSIPLTLIKTNPFQPRDEFDNRALETLAASIKEQGIIQPVTVRKVEGKPYYQLISGERRYRASKLAGLDAIPAFIRVANDQQMVEMALIENVHREDLNAVEIAFSYQRMLDECGMSLNDIAQRISLDRSTISNYLRLLKLPAEAQIALRDGQISMGHARALISITNPLTLLRMLEDIILHRLSVREVEKRVKEGKVETKKKQVVKTRLPEPFVEKRAMLEAQLNCKVKVTRNTNGKGNIQLPFTSDADFERLMQQLQPEK